MRTEHSQLLIILLIVFIGFIGTSLAYPIFPPLFLHPTYSTIIPSSWSEASRSMLLGIALATYPLSQFLGSPILGSYSDRYGRKPVLMLSLAGSVLGYGFSALSLQINSLWLLLISRFLTGMMEGNVSIVQAMAADLQTISKYRSFGWISGIAAIGYVMGPLIGGFLSDKHLVSWFSFALPFYLATLLAAITVILAWSTLTETKTERHGQLTPASQPTSLWQQFNLIHRFRILFKNTTLKYLLIVSSIFTFGIDIFYEFGPVYLTQTWNMTPAWIAIYNAALSITLAIGSTWLPYKLSRSFAIERIIASAIISTAVILILMVVWPWKLPVFLLFALSGFTIAIGTTIITIQISDKVDPSIQGEALGAQISLRMFGDTFICLIGGVIIIGSVITPLLLSGFITLLAAGIYITKFQTAHKVQKPKNSPPSQ